ncbi:MAG TPA: ABC transporter substrate-binding protein [Candidatus Binatia bacterium]|jgi:NitT/TauT family transport system substrate-binding protein
MQWRFTLLVFFLIAFTPKSDAQIKERIALGYSGSSGIFAGQWIAQEAGLYQKYGLNTDQVLLPAASRMVQAMLGGDVPFATAGGNAAVDADLAGGDLIMVGAIAKVPAFYVMALPEIGSVENLRGKAVGVTRFGSSTDFTIRYVLKKAGLDPGRDVTILQLGDLFALVAALKTRQIVAAPFSSPTNVQAQELGAHVLVNMGKAGLYFPHDAWMARRSFIQSRSDLVKRILMAYSEGVHKLHTDAELAKRTLRKYARVNDPKLVDAVYQYAIDYIEKIPYNTREGIQEVLNQVADRNPKAKNAKPEEFYDDRYVKELESAGFYRQLWGK